MSMPLAVLEVPKEEARRSLREYRELLRTERSREYEFIARGYREIERGRQLIQLTPTILAGGLDDLGRPNLAVCRADARRVFLDLAHNAITFNADRGWTQDRLGFLGGNHVTVPWPGDHGTCVTCGGPIWRCAAVHTWTAVVPLVPPRHLPAGRAGHTTHTLDRYHILWEADWQRAPQPRDPALLRHIGGDLWSVLAVWDLTPLEAAVLAGRGAG